MTWTQPIIVIIIVLLKISNLLGHKGNSVEGKGENSHNANDKDVLDFQWCNIVQLFCEYEKPAKIIKLVYN